MPVVTLLSTQIYPTISNVRSRPTLERQAVWDWHLKSVTFSQTVAFSLVFISQLCFRNHKK